MNVNPISTKNDMRQRFQNLIDEYMEHDANGIATGLELVSAMSSKRGVLYQIRILPTPPRKENQK